MQSIFNWLKVVIPVVGKVLPVLNLVVYLFAGFGMYQTYYTLSGKNDPDIICSKYDTKETTKDINKREMVLVETSNRQNKFLEALRRLDKEESRTIAMVDELEEKETPSTNLTPYPITVNTKPTSEIKKKSHVKKPLKHKKHIPPHKAKCSDICLTKAEIELLRKTANAINQRILSHV